MRNKSLQVNLSSSGVNSLSNSSKWDRAILEAKKRIREIKRSITRFESLRAQGMEFPEPKQDEKLGNAKQA